MARTEKVIMTNMCMVFSENRVLVQDKTDDDYSGITFPGGHVERGESFTDAVIREVWEETGLKISEPKLCGMTGRRRMTKKWHDALWVRSPGKRGTTRNVEHRTSYMRQSLLFVSFFNSWMPWRM